MIATQASTATKTPRYAAATYFSEALTTCASRQKLPQLAQTSVEPFPGQLDPVHRPREREQRRPGDAERKEHRGRHLRPVEREDDRVDEVVRQSDREPAHRDQHHAEERVDRAQV